MVAIPLRRIEGKYEILDKLGEGGMGAVYKVRHRLLDEVRVIKVMRPHLVTDEELKARFLREARGASKLRHPNIAQLYDFTVDDEDGTAYIVMEFIDGLTLEDVLRGSGPPPLGLALEIAQQALRALGYLHTKGYIHRDISPDNLMLAEDADGAPLVKLIDLGIAKILGTAGEGSLTGTGMFLGKVRYSPPEQFGTEGASMIDARGDIYSLGIVLYELLTGHYPIQGRDPSSLIAGHLLRPPLPFADSDPTGQVPEGVRALVLRALAKAPEERFASTQELARALTAFRKPSDIAPGDLRSVLSRSTGGTTVRIPALDPGSTQDRLDFQFGMGTTPHPRTVHRGTAAANPRTAILDTAATIEAQLASGDLLTAETELQWAVDTFGEQPELSALRLRLQQRRSREVELQVRALLREARSLLDARNFEGARERLQKGRALDPRNREVLTLLEAAEAGIRRAAEETRQARSIAEATLEIEAALASRDYRAAEMKLYAAEASYGEQEAFSALHARLGEMRRREAEGRAQARRRAEQLKAAAAAVEGCLGRSDLEEAGRLLTEAVAAYGEEPALTGLRARLDELELRARQGRAEALLASARDLFARGQMQAALEELEEAARLDPGNPDVPALEGEIEQELVRRAELERRRQQAEALLAEARGRCDRGELTAAREVLGEAAQLDPENTAVPLLQQEIDAELERRAAEARRAEQLAAALDAIDAHLTERDPDAAAKLLDETAAGLGAAGELRERRERLEELRRQAREAEVAVLLATARDRRQALDFAGALTELGRVERLDPDQAEARALRAEIEAELQRFAAETRRAQQLAAAAAAIRVPLDAGNVERAEELLVEAETTYGKTEALRELRGRVEELQAQARARQREIEAELRRQAEEAQRAEQLAAALAAIDACLEGGRAEEAAKLLPGAVAAFGDAEPLRERWERIEELRRRMLAEKVEELVARARRLFSAGEVEAAFGGLREALRLAPDHEEARALAGEIEAELRRRDAESRRAADLAQALLGIDKALESGGLDAAARLLPGAVATFGDLPELRTRWDRLESARRQGRVASLLGEARTLLQAGDSGRAVRKLRQALDLEPGSSEAAALLAQAQTPPKG